MPFSLPYRQIHLDFHTGPAIPDVGRDFSAVAFASTMKAARVNSVTVFAKCHHGHLYYNTDRPERHPGLARGLDLLEQQVAALHREGIRAPIYISVQCDEYAANTHPEWVARNADSSQVKWAKGVFDAGWQILDMSSPYQEYVVEQTREILGKFHPVDGIFFDMCWDQPSTTLWAVEGMRKAGLNPEVEGDRLKYAHQVALVYMDRLHGMVQQSAPGATVYFNGRPLFNQEEEISFQEQVEIESLPTGGWGYMYFPVTVRYARTFDRPYLGMTARFHKSWADFGGYKPYPALEFETSQMMAHGARASIGDQLHPRGVLDSAAYELIGKIYQRIAEREPWLEGAVPQAQVGLFKTPTNATRTGESISKSDEGATRMLTQLRQQFNVVRPETDLSTFELLVLPDSIPVEGALAEKLGAYLDRGGRLLLSGTSGLSADATRALLPLGIEPEGWSPFTTTYFRFRGETTDHVMYERGVRARPAEGGQTLAAVVEPYFERAWDHFSSHQQTPSDRLTGYAAALVHENVGYISAPVFSAFALHGNLPYRRLVGEVLERLLLLPLARMDGPSGAEITVTRQGRRTVAHVLYYPAERRTETLDLIEDIVPLYGLKIALKLPQTPVKVSLAPEGTPLAFAYQDGYVNLTLPELHGHAMIVLE
jgi:hypothetical protein